MKKPGKSTKIADPLEVFNHACNFLGTDQFLRETTTARSPLSGWSATIAAPAMVLSAFAAELFLKCLLLLEGQEVPPIHRLDILFRRLSHKSKRRIESAWEADARPKILAFGKQINRPTDLSNALVKCGKAFDQLRYYYEDPASVEYYIGDFAWILMRVIVEIKPEWRSEDPPSIRSTLLIR